MSAASSYDRVVTQTPPAEQPPIACTLEAGDVPLRVAEWQDVLASVTAREPIHNGVRLVLAPGTPVGPVADLAAAEQQCCAFFRFAMTIDGRGAALEVTAPPDAAQIVEDLFGVVGTETEHVDLSGARMRNVNLSGARIIEAMLVNTRLSGLIIGFFVNDVEVGPLISAELDRRHPERMKLRPTDADGAREAWSVIEGLWAATKERAAALPEATLHERVDGEWSFLETLRHLVFVTDGWISGTVLGRTGQFHPFAMPPSFITDVEPFGIDMAADPPFAEVVVAREERMAVVRDLVAGLDDADLGRQCGQHTLLHCLRTVFDEEWAHDQFANRDLDVLVAR